MRQQVVTERVEPAQHGGKIEIARPQLVERLLDRERGRLPVDAGHALGLLLPKPDAVADDSLESILQLQDPRTDPLLFGFGELREDRRLHDLPVLDRGQREAVRRLDQGDAVAHRLFAQRRQGLGMPVGDLAADPLDLGRIGLRLEGRRNRRLQLVDHRPHVVSQRRSPTARQPEGQRPFRLIEAIDVDPVERLGVLGAGLDRGADERQLADAGGAGHEQVVAFLIDVEGELDRPQCARVANRAGRLGRLGHLGRVVEGDEGGVAGGVKSRGIESVHGRESPPPGWCTD